MLKILLIEPYYTGSHKKWANDYRRLSNHNVKILSLKGQFWKWRMVYLIKDNNEKDLILISQNKRNTIYKIEIDSTIYEIKIHYKKKKSVYKNNKKIAEFALEHSLTGLEFLSCIPGSIGGAIRMNSGCYGEDISKILHSIEVIDIPDEKGYARQNNLLANKKFLIQLIEIRIKCDFRFLMYDKHYN